VEHGIHEGKAVRVVYQLTAGKGLLLLELGFIMPKVEIFVGLLFEVDGVVKSS